MHRLLQISDVLEEIVYWLASPADVLRFGLVCKPLWDVARPLLWKSVDGRSLKGIIPWDIEAIEANYPHRLRQDLYVDEDEMDFIYFSRSLTDEEWLRIKGYTCLIRELSIDDMHPWVNYPWVLGILSTQEAVRDPLFPNLLRIFIDFSDLDTGAMCLRFLKQQQALKELHLRLDKAGYRMPAGFLSKVGDMEQLQKISVFSLWIGPLQDKYAIVKEIETAVTWVLWDLKNVTRVAVEARTKAALVLSRLAALPLLQTLDLSFWADLSYIHRSTPNAGTNHSPFPSLRNIHLDQQSAEVSVGETPLDHISSPFLTQASISCITNTCLSDVLSLVSRSWSPRLTSVTIRWKSLFVEQDTVINLSPLTSCLHLEHVSLIRERCLLLSEEHLEPILSLPRLRTLSLKDVRSGHHGWTDISFLSPEFPLRVAARCPTLETLCAPLDLRRFEDIPPDAVHSTSASQLRYLQCPTLLCSQPDVAVAFLKSLFPMLKAFESYSPTGRMIASLLAEKKPRLVLVTCPGSNAWTQMPH